MDSHIAPAMSNLSSVSDCHLVSELNPGQPTSQYPTAAGKQLLVVLPGANAVVNVVGNA